MVKIFHDAEANVKLDHSLFPYLATITPQAGYIIINLTYAS